MAKSKSEAEKSKLVFNGIAWVPENYTDPNVGKYFNGHVWVELTLEQKAEAMARMEDKENAGEPE